jgi:S-disulfanyl-L-cysteine oxidoreductase SoxD
MKISAASITAGMLALFGILTSAQTGRTVDTASTDQQASRGQILYAQQCASCHGATRQGVSGPPLQGDPFVNRWRTEPLSALIGKIRNTMPLDAPGQLTAPQAEDLAAFLLKDIVPQSTAPPGPAATGALRPPLGNLAQLMRGIFFPNANMIFTVQTHDPAAPAPKPTNDAQANGFSWVDWGAGIYGGWQLVDNAAIALADVSPIMLNADLRCENGKPAPVTDPDWIKFTEQMISVSKQIYRLSQTRNQEAVSDATGDLSDACAACHQAYREGRGRGAAPAPPGNPQANAFRCTPRR